MGQAITSTRPLSYRATRLDGIEAYRVNGTPADCVALGAHNWERVDAVLSGINLGPNLGNSIWHSGTLAAAKQAALLGIRGIALSTPAGSSEPDFDGIAPYVLQVLECLLQHPELPLVNVKFPGTRRASAGPASRCAFTTAPWCRGKIRWAASTSGSRCDRPREPRRAPICGWCGRATSR